MASRGKVRNAAESETGQDAAGLGARRAAALAVADLIGQERPPALDEALAAALRAERLESGDAALARAIALATFRRLGQIRRVLADRLDKGLPVGKPRLFSLLATGTAQILDLAVPDHAAVDLAVRLAKADHRTAGFAGMVNAVLRRVAREREAILAAAEPLRDNTPDWLARRWVSAYGPERAAEIARAHLTSAPIDLTLRNEGEGQAWAERLGATLLPTGSLRMPPDGAAIPDLPGFGEAAWWVQDAAAAIPARLLGVGEGERVLDLCAAPGGKTMQLASRGATVTALDRSAPRLERLRDNLARLGLRPRSPWATRPPIRPSPSTRCSSMRPARPRARSAATPTSPGPRTSPTSSASRSCRPGSSTGRRRWCGRAGGSSTAPAPWSGPRARRRSPPSSPATRDSPACRSGRRRSAAGPT